MYRPRTNRSIDDLAPDTILRAAVSAPVLLALSLLVPSCGREAPPGGAEVVAVPVASAPSDPGDPVWNRAPVCAVPLIVQDMVEPRLLAPSTPEVRVQAATDGARIAFRLVWVDSDPNDLPGPGRFSDACAIQFPIETGPDLPAPQMGEPGRGVEISYWSASRQAIADGRGRDIQAIYPNAYVDHYPFEAASLRTDSAERYEMEKRYAPARAAGNITASHEGGTVEDLVAEGPGTLSPSRHRWSQGTGRRTPAGWEVVVSRPAPSGLDGGNRSTVAFAIWEGGRQEVGARKMRSAWIPLAKEERAQVAVADGH